MPAWAELLDNEAIHLLLSAYYPDGFLACGGGGDYVLPNTSTPLRWPRVSEEDVRYQSLHLDVGGPVHAFQLAPAIGVNFVLEDLSCADAPLRVVPFSHRDIAEPPELYQEPEAQGATKGSIMINLH